MTEQQRQQVMTTYVNLEGYLQEYRKALLWFTYGKHTATSRPTLQVTPQLIQELGEKITTLLAEIQSQVHDHTDQRP
jgi:hypothetical protein